MTRRRRKSRAHPAPPVVPPATTAETTFPTCGFHTQRTIVLILLGTLLLKSLIFEPISWWPLAFVCLVPWLVVIALTARAPRVYAHSFLLGGAFFLINMRWLYAATGAGYVALSVYLAVCFPLMACPLRHAVRRRRWPLAVVLPFVWTAGEFLRAVAFSGFPWFFLSHGLHGVLTAIQVSDLVGAYGVSFVVASVNGAVADVVIAAIQRRGGDAIGASARGRRIGFGVMLVAVAFTAIYGMVRLGQETITPGPKIAVVQGDFVMSVHGEEANDAQKRRVYFEMMDEAAAQQPDLYLLPETPWIMYLNPEARNLSRASVQSFDALRDRAARNRAYVVTGSASQIDTPHDLLAAVRRYNSATVFHPDGSEPDRYDKVHLVYFGEVVPFRFGRLRFLYFWLNWLMPFSGPDHDYEYSLFHGEGFKTFPMRPTSQPERTYRFGVPICYEDVMPYVARAFACGGGDTKRVDFLLNISNDGWFGRGHQQPQHLAICVFRAVENRVGIARSVNTGISAFIEPDGRVHDMVRGDAATPWPGQCGFSVARIGVDSRFSFYSRHGDWFAWGCVLISLLIYVDYWIARARGHRMAHATRDPGLAEDAHT